jgi:hypothetical protein
VTEKTLLAELPYTFQRKPLLIAGQARKYYGLEPSGREQGDIDLIVSPEDFEALRTKFPAAWASGELHDQRISIGNYECYASFNGLAYEALSAGAIEQEDHAVIALQLLCWIELVILKTAKVH